MKPHSKAKMPSYTIQQRNAVAQCYATTDTILWKIDRAPKMSFGDVRATLSMDAEPR